MARSFALSLLAALALALPSAAADAPGVTGDSILIGGTVPLSGPASFYAPIAVGAKAYFDYVNSKGGVNGRKIDYRYLDDQYNPGLTVQLTRQLVEQDKVFAIFNSAGTEQNLAVRQYLNEQKVPQLFVGSALGDWKRAPYTMGYLPSFFAEGRVYGRRIAATMPNAKVAVLYEKTPFGQQMADGLRVGLGKKAKIVAMEGTNVTDTDVSSAISRLRSSNAQVLAVFELPKQALQSFIATDKLGWKPRFYVSAISIDPAVMAIARFNTQGRTTEGATSLAWLKDPTAPRWQSDRGVKLYQAIMKSFAPADASPGAVAHFYGMAAAFTMVDALRKAGKNLTRDSLMRAVRALNEQDNPFMIPGVVIKTGPRDYFPIDQAQLYTFKKDRWQPVGPLIRVAA